MTAVSDTATPDLGAIKRKQRVAWSSGDFHMVAALISITAERLVDNADLQANWKVLDVATGSGNAAIAAARLGAEVVGVDYVPSLLDRGRVRALAEGLQVSFVEGDAEALPFEDDSFDATISIYGAMFAPDHRRAAAEILRVTRPGGRIALASWTPEGFIGDLFRATAGYVPPPAGLQSPMLWGTESYLRELFGDGLTSLTVTEETFTFRFESAEEFVAYFRRWYGPTVKAFEAVGADGKGDLEDALVALARRHDRLGTGEAIAIPATYAEAVGTTR